MSPGAPAVDAEAMLALAERRVQAVTAALLHGQPEQVEAASRDLQQVSLLLSNVLQGIKVKSGRHQQLLQRLGHLVRGVALQREALMRRSAVVEMSLHSMIPASRTPTYGAASSYGHGVRQSGAFKMLSA